MATRIGDHVYWLPPGPPDRPSLCAVVGERRTILLDAGSSPRHTRAFLEGLATKPDGVIYTHSHWDHVLGGVETGAIVFAHRLTAEALRELAVRDWSDEGLANGRYSEHIIEELPSPRAVEVAQADVIFGDEGLDLDLGGVTIRVRHVGGDHCAESCVMLVEPDGILFIGDCLGASPDGAMTAAKALPLCETILAFDAQRFVEGHHAAVSSRSEMEEYIEKIRQAARGVAADPQDEDATYVAEAFRVGLGA